MRRSRLTWVLALGFSLSVAVATGGCVDNAALAGEPQKFADKVLVEKSAHRLTLLRAGEQLRVYSIALGAQPKGPKEREGDGRTPEGLYTIDSRNAASGFHKALHISYPNDVDRRRAASAGASPGGDIMIHGIKNGFGWLGPLHRLSDWTQGCIAVTDDEIDEIWDMVKDGTTVEIVP